jgi:methylated-DNA-protein-cysteine methyltransferase-like protein
MNPIFEESEPSVYEQIYALVRQVPRGQVVTYGQIAEHVGRCSARLVGYAMAGLRSGEHPDVPWQRVVNREGKISITDAYGGALQRQLLEEEGVRFNENGQINLNLFGWFGAP